MRTMIDFVAMFGETKAAAESWIQIMRTGKWDHPKYGKIEIKPDDLHLFKDNFDNNVRGVKLFVDIDHDPNHEAVGEFKELRVEGEKLMARIGWNEDGKELLGRGKYQYFSPEFAFQYKDPESGKVHKDVLMGGGITNRPFLKGMDPVELHEEEGYVVYFAEKDPKDKPYDPDNDGDDDEGTNPSDNPDWILDVLSGVTPWPEDKGQQAELTKIGASKEACNAAYQIRQKQLKGGKKQLSEPGANKDKEAQQARAKKYGIKPHEGGSITKPSQYADVPDDKFADPVNYAYPITPDYVMAAYRYFAKPDNQSKYSEAERKILAKRIYHALPEKNQEEAKTTFNLDEKACCSECFSGKQCAEHYFPDNGSGVQATPPKDVDAGQFNEGGGNPMPNNPEGVVSMKEYEELQKQVKVQEQAMKRMQLSEKVQGFMFNESSKSGKILPAQRDAVIDLMMGMDDEQAKKFGEFIEGLPDAVKFNDEKGHGNSPTAKTREDMVTERATVLMSEGMDYRSALIQADQDIPVKL